MNEKRFELVDEVANSFVNLCKEKLDKRIKSLYSVGSYAFGRIAIERPDLNFLLILDGYAIPEDYLAIGEICREMPSIFKDRCSIRPEFRPFRVIYPKVRSNYDVFLNPIIQSTNEIKMRGMIFTKWFTDGMKSANRLLLGDDFLSTISIGEITKQDLFQGALFDLPFLTIPLSRAPAQYGDDEPDLLFNEALTNGKMLCYLGMEIAMNEDELRKKEFLKYIQNKETFSDFFRERYGEEAARLVTVIFEGRDHYLEYKDSKERAKEMFSCALQIAEYVQRKLFQMRK